jgi:DNA-binding LytR/AlgR family response regulator
MSEHITIGQTHVPISEILVIRGEGNYSNIITQTGRMIVVLSDAKVLCHNARGYPFHSSFEISPS